MVEEGEGEPISVAASCVAWKEKEGEGEGEGGCRACWREGRMEGLLSNLWRGATMVGANHTSARFCSR